jgi:fatty-acyl-CoA synthase
VDVSLLLGMAAETMPDRPGLGTTAEHLTYAQLLDRAERTATWLIRRGVRSAALLDVNSEAVPALIFGAAIARVPFAPLNYRLGDERLDAILKRLAPACAIADPVMAHRARVEGIDAVPRAEFAAQASALERTRNRRADPDDVAIQLFTSGTSGEPKATILRQRHLVSYIVSTVELMSAGENEATLVSVPPYHIAGISAVLSSVYAGRRIVYLPGFDAAEWVDTVREQGITHAMVVPTMLARIIDRLEADGGGIPTLRHLAYGGGRMPLPVIKRALDLLRDTSFVNAYGLTETSSTVSLLGPDDHRRAHQTRDPAILRRLGSVGRPLPGVEIEIRDLDGSGLPPGNPGHVWVRGDQVSGEYVDGPESGGWFDTNDLGWFDEHGFLFLEGRDDDVIVRGGENLSPGEIEDVLIDHPGIAEAAVVGLPDVEWGEVPVAAVVGVEGFAPSGEEVRAWVRARLRSSRVPDRVVFVDQLPYTDTGKLLRRAIRSELLAGSTSS